MSGKKFDLYISRLYGCKIQNSEACCQTASFKVAFSPQQLMPVGSSSAVLITGDSRTRAHTPSSTHTHTLPLEQPLTLHLERRRLHRGTVSPS